MREDWPSLLAATVTLGVLWGFVFLAVGGLGSRYPQGAVAILILTAVASVLGVREVMKPTDYGRSNTDSEYRDINVEDEEKHRAWAYLRERFERHPFVWSVVAYVVASLLSDAAGIVVVGLFSIWWVRHRWDTTPDRLARESRDPGKRFRSPKLRNIVSFGVFIAIAAFSIGTFLTSWL